MVRRLPQLSSTRIQFINHANYKINWFKCDGLRKRHKNIDSLICQTLFSSLTSMSRTKTISRPGMASYRKSLLTSHSVMEMCFSCFMNTKYKCLRCELPICNKCSVSEENEDAEGWTAGKSVTYCEAWDRDLKRAALGLPFKHCISAFR